MTRYLVRLANEKRCTPKDTRKLSNQIRELLGSRESIGHLRVSSRAIEFDLFAEDKGDLESRVQKLENNLAKIVTLKQLDTAPPARSKLEVLNEGIQLFNEERFWECHEVLEQIWHPATGRERDIIQGLILTAAALVHHQKNEDNVCLSMLRRAQAKLGSQDHYQDVDLVGLKERVGEILKTGQPQAFKIGRV